MMIYKFLVIVSPEMWHVVTRDVTRGVRESKVVAVEQSV